mgnify:CR=1 FL=1
MIYIVIVWFVFVMVLAVVGISSKEGGDDDN